MPINLQRQLNMLLGQGSLTYLSEVEKPAWKGIDGLDKYILSLAPGYVSGGFFQIAGSTSQVIALPELYDSAERLCCLISAFGQVRLSTVIPVTGTSVCTLNGTSAIEAVTYFQSRVTSITITTPTATPVKVRYSLYQLPDLEDADSFRGGVYNFGRLTDG